MITGMAVAAALFWYARLNAEPDIEEEVLIVPPRTSPPVNPHQEQLINDFERFIDSLRTERDIPAIAVAIVRKGQPIYINAMGHKTNHTNDAVNLKTKFRLASVSKGFTSILVSKMVQEGVISWEDPIHYYLTDFRPEPFSYSDSITIRNIISQTSGFPYQAYSNLIEDGWTLPEMINALAELKVATKPGTQYSYQNVAYSIIEPILERQTGREFPKLLNTYLFGPLQMENASAEFEDMKDSPNAAKPHRRTRYSYIPVQLSSSYYNTAAAGGVNASIEDMAKYLQMLLGDHQEAVDSSVLDEVFEPRIITPLLNRYYRKWLRARRAYYGLGWRILPLENDTIVYHGGYANGFKSHIALDRDDEVAICILSNSSDNLVNEAGPYFFHLYYEYRDAINLWDKNP
ncbi:serine hydrolase domain-containing protein [Fulvivirga sedimenti]|uniref:Beta-lactamase family protein n=1 Tax=Fulvivirga sedimenti TaxID=2879465 RepID=A0A9X1HUI2_9BACT|nr:serine hydrolase domain-containing protein [Fulvivirga sedimenti]MCA6075180.1 beta-lactamase family protein [Fulvivirga sedimenti]MCA6076357.1 beta-lactamase family protein [Fulvivirga sedimenti]MCA6077485.1 beta-lactamase family protein [Fulvivirga sedimenti]